ncbi:hypothetical protein RYA05_03770 [Pseudomonas syringae pv. actinidiae]|nr:hypothetical protein [Pseudomonas syringae pv. actinidiae]
MNRNFVRNGNGEILVEHSYSYQEMDREGNVIKRTRRDHPYNFDDFVSWVNPKYHGKTNPCTIKPEGDKQLHTAYTDRMSGWDREKYSRCAEKHFTRDNGGIRHGGGAVATAFLAEYFGDPELELVKIVECCDHSSGYEIWRYDFIYTPAKKGDLKA